MSLTYGAGRDAQNNPFVITAGGETLQGEVTSTPNDLAFRHFDAGWIRLKAGRQTVQISGPEKGRGPNISLECIELRPPR